MPKFLYTIIAFTVLAWVGWVRILTLKTPDSPVNIFLFLGTLFLALALTFSVPLFFLFNKKTPTYMKNRKVYRNALKWTFFVASGPSIYLAMRAFSADTTPNLILFAVLYVMIFLQMRSAK
jgi:hypothetical protein